MGLKGNTQPKPYVDSALQLDKKKFATLKKVNVIALLELLTKRQKKPQKDSTETASEEDTSQTQLKKDFVLGLNQVTKAFNRGEFGAIVLDEELTKPSTAEHFFALLGKTQEDCKFFVVKNLSSRAAKTRNFGKLSIVGIRKNHPFLDSIVDDSVKTESVESSQASFKKPTFTVPVGKKNKAGKKKKKVIKKVTKK